jgi:phosphoribosyl-dephospho-CoA transferase
MWVAAALLRAPFVVVRRDKARDGWVPVGVRGDSRAERHAAWVRCSEITLTITPESLADSRCWHFHECRTMPAFAALDAIASAAAAHDLAWGPAGSVGFELASGVSVVHDDSDIDLVVRPTPSHTRNDLASFGQSIAGISVRVDVAIECVLGSVALGEWLQSPDRVLVKAETGPRLGAFHW